MPGGVGKVLQAKNGCNALQCLRFAECVTSELSLSAEVTMEGMSRLYSHAAWQAQFHELQRSEQPDHPAIKAALQKLVMDVTSAKLLPDHVSQEITACFLVSEVKLKQVASLCVAIT